MNTGNYVRTKDYGFIKVKSFYYNEDMIHILDENCNEYDFSKELVDDFKSSPNIIDLIEVGDIITTNNLCGEITKIDGNKIYTTCYDGEYCSTSDIKSIVTKECFESMEYKVGE